MPTCRLRWCLPMVALLLAVGPALGARATTMIGGEQLNPREHAHEFHLGFPGLGYQLDVHSTGKRTTGLQIGLLYWPLTVQLGVSTRTLMGINGRAVTSFRFEAGAYVGLYGGSRAIYQNMRWGRSRYLMFAIAPTVNLGIASSIDIGEAVSLVIGVQSPIAIWLIPASSGFWVEWPILGDLGLEFDVSFRTTLFTRASVGPSLAFAGPDQFVGLYVGALVGLQWIY